MKSWSLLAALAAMVMMPVGRSAAPPAAGDLPDPRHRRRHRAGDLRRRPDFTLLYDAGSNDDFARGAPPAPDARQPRGRLSARRPAGPDRDRPSDPQPSAQGSLRADARLSSPPIRCAMSGIPARSTGSAAIAPCSPTPATRRASPITTRSAAPARTSPTSSPRRCYGRQPPSRDDHRAAGQPASPKALAVPLGANARMTFLHADGSRQSSFNENSLVVRVDLGIAAHPHARRQRGRRQEPAVQPAPAQFGRGRAPRLLRRRAALGHSRRRPSWQHDLLAHRLPRRDRRQRLHRLGRPDPLRLGDVFPTRWWSPNMTGAAPSGAPISTTRPAARTRARSARTMTASRAAATISSSSSTRQARSPGLQPHRRLTHVGPFRTRIDAPEAPVRSVSDSAPRDPLRIEAQPSPRGRLAMNMLRRLLASCSQPSASPGPRRRWPGAMPATGRSARSPGATSLPPPPPRCAGCSAPIR